MPLNTYSPVWFLFLVVCAALSSYTHPPCSQPQLLKQVSSAEVKQEAADKHQQLEQQRALDMLPGSFEVLRAIYGERGPCVKPKSEVGCLV